LYTGMHNDFSQAPLRVLSFEDIEGVNEYDVVIYNNPGESHNSNPCQHDTEWLPSG